MPFEEWNKWVGCTHRRDGGQNRRKDGRLMDEDVGKKRPRRLWNYLMDFRSVKETVKVRWVCPVIEICSGDTLQFSLGVLGVDVFYGTRFLKVLQLRGKRKKGKIETREKMNWHGEKSKRGCEIENDSGPDFHRLLRLVSDVFLCVLFIKTVPLPGSTIHLSSGSHSVCQLTLLCERRNVILSFMHMYVMGGRHSNGRNTTRERCWLHSRTDLTSFVQFLGMSATHESMQMCKGPIKGKF